MSFSEWNIDRTRGQTMLYLTCSMINLVHNGVSRVKDFGYLGIVLQAHKVSLRDLQGMSALIEWQRETVFLKRYSIHSAIKGAFTSLK